LLGNITTKSDGAWVGGNLTIGGEVQLNHSDFTSCTTGSGCILRVIKGKVQTTDNVTPWIGDEEQNSVFRRSTTNPNDTFYSTTGGTAATAGANASAWQQYLRVGVTETSLQWPAKDDIAMIVAGSSEIRGDLLVRKANGTTFGNEGNNQKLNLSSSTSTYTELDTKIIDGKVLLTAKQKSSRDPTITPANLAISSATTLFSADGASTKIGINTPTGTTPAATLDVVGDAKISQRMMVGTDPTESTFFADGGSKRVGIKTSNPNKELDVVGSASISNSLIIGFSSTENPESNDKLKINGNAQFVGSTRADGYYYNSDRRYKSDIEALQSPLENLFKLSGYTYFNKLSQKQDIGVIAQEVETVYPELVQTDADGYKSVQYGNLVAPIIEAIKELAHKIDSLFTLYVSQQAKIDSLEARLLKLETK